MTLDIVAKEVLSSLAYRNYRGVTTDELIYSIQYYRDELRHELTEGDKVFCEASVKSLEGEIIRRRNIDYSGVRFASKDIIHAVKAALDIADVLSWYTEVFTHKRQWTYRCTLHGPDKHPSGVIYKDEQRFHCFVCEKHGDVFDAVMYFERVDLPAAIKKLARHVGLDVKPILKGKEYHDIRP